MVYALSLQMQQGIFKMHTRVIDLSTLPIGRIGTVTITFRDPLGAIIRLLLCSDVVGEPECAYC